ncbi:hypothetical protein [Candidatus Anaplasma sp. TIGMIC]|uniref:hypothetical protein n=1 Tax=Candidatus Anaplasma sp. TIGMIC TaxID=3020713 RepID=UPI00232B82B8|nr:hypothetical protein [Candidatus Anaplasma sp. TIGMIC]
MGKLGLERKKIVTTGFMIFAWYVRITMALVVLLFSPLILLRVCSMPFLGSQEFSWAKVVSRRRFREGERVRRGLLHRLIGPDIKQMFAYSHALLSNMAFFTLAAKSVLSIAGSIAKKGIEGQWELAAVYALVPTTILFVMSIAYHYYSRLFQCREAMPLRYEMKLLWRTPEKLHDRLEDSTLNLLFREQVGDAVSMSSLSRMDKQLLFGIPTALTGALCYVYDCHTGEELEAREIRANACKSAGGVSTDISKKLGMFRA